MKLFLPDDDHELGAAALKHVPERFDAYLPLADTVVFRAGAAEIVMQRLKCPLFSIAVYESISTSDQPVDLSFKAPLLSIVFAINGSLKFVYPAALSVELTEGFYAIYYAPADSRVRCVIPEGHALVFRIDLDPEMLRQVTEDYPQLQDILKCYDSELEFARRLPYSVIDPFIRWSIRQIFEYGETKSERSLFIHARCTDLLRYYLHAAGSLVAAPAAQNSQLATSISGIAEFIQQHLDTPLSKEIMARNHGISVRTLERYFGVYFSQSLGKYILDKRMSTARVLLLETSLPLLNVALMVGYSELTNFTRAFKAFYGYLPSQVRK